MEHYAGRTCQHRMRKQITCSFKLCKQWNHLILGAEHEQSHDKHTSSDNRQNRIGKNRR